MRIQVAGAVLAGLACAGLAGIVMFCADKGSPVYARVATAGNILAVESKLGDASLLYLVDNEKRKLLVYMVDAERKSLQLLAVRNYTWDLEMDTLNNDGLLPDTVKANVTGGGGGQ